MHQYDVFGIGNPLMDIVVSADEAMLGQFGLVKGMFNLVDYDRSQQILSEISHMKTETEAGDSTANSMAGIANLGGKPIYQGCIGECDYGQLYEKKTKEQGIESRLVRVKGKTGIAIAFITPDSERSFATHLGVACTLKKEYLALDDIKKSSYLHLTGYQLEDPTLRETALAAIDYAKSAGVKVSVDVADKGVVSRNRDFITDLLKKHVDLVFANEEESFALCGEPPEKAILAMGAMASIACLKIGKNGSLIIKDEKVHQIPGYKAKAVDTTGAGDMYAAGVLFGLTHGHDVEAAGRIGSFAAARIVEIFGARPKFSLRDMIRDQKIV